MMSALGLIALALGYKAFIDACKEKEGVKLLGQVIGIVVMIAAVLTMFCGAMKCMSKYGGYGMSRGYGPMAAKGACPFTK